MRALIDHHLRILRESPSITPVAITGLRDCHAKDLHSVVLHRDPMIRMYYAGSHHTLYKNYRHSLDMSLAYHSHHCDLTLVRLFGNITNIKVDLQGAKGGLLRAYDYVSCVGNQRRSPEFVARDETYTVAADKRDDFQVLGLRARDIHTIYVPRFEEAAWLVLEGKEYLNYKPVCYAPSMPTTDPEFYTPMTRSEIHELLERTIKWTTT